LKDKEVFVRGTDNTLYNIWQAPPGGNWSAWESLGLPGVSPITGRIDIFKVGTDNTMKHKWFN
jgi:hypothetical protein